MFNGSNVIITGGSSGIGKGLAMRLAQEGANLALVARDKDKLARTREEALSSSCYRELNVESFTCDVTVFENVKQTMNEIAEKMGPPDCLINSAGMLSGNYFENIPLDDFRSLMDTNFFGTLNFIKAVLPFFRKKGSGRIINICSLSGMTGVFGYTSYCASKHAVMGLTEALRSELKPQGIHIHLVNPPEVQTPMLDKIKKERPVETSKVASTMPALTVDETVDAIIKGVAKGRYLIIPGLSTSIMIRLGKTIPSLERWIVDYRVKKYYQGPDG
jgi:3-dehydrosphinganine reductase